MKTNSQNDKLMKSCVRRCISLTIFICHLCCYILDFKSLEHVSYMIIFFL